VDEYESQIQKEGSNRTIHLHYGGSTDKLIMIKSASPIDVIGISEHSVFRVKFIIYMHFDAGEKP
jgi:hypothetical protein